MVGAVVRLGRQSHPLVPSRLDRVVRPRISAEGAVGRGPRVPGRARLSIEVAAGAEVGDAPGDPVLPSFEARFGLAADPLDFDGVGAGEADAVEDLPDPREVDAPAVADGGEVPVFEAPAVVLQVDVADQVLDLLELVGGV